jgi:DHA2 family multidrug resistance protein
MAAPDKSAGQPGTAHSEHPPLSGITLIIAAVLVAAGNVLVLIDTTIANVSIPNIAASMGAAPHEGVWVLTSYAAADAVTVCLTGWLTARFGPGRTMFFSMAGFGLVSGLCGLAPSLGWLVLFRVLQGAFGGPLIALSQYLIMNIFPKERLAFAIGVWTTASLAAPATGPALGGYICDNWSWPWIFLINVPIAALTCFGVWRIFWRRDPPPQQRQIDVVGLVLMITWIGAIQFILDLGLELDWFESPRIIAGTIVAVVAFVAFLIWELTEPVPIVNLRVFGNYAFATSTIITFICLTSFYGTLVLSPLWLQTNMGYTATWAGVVAAPQGLVMMVMTPITTRLLQRIDGRVLMSIGMTILASNYIWRAHFASTVTYGHVLLANGLVGLAMSCFVVPSINLSFSTLKHHETADANGVSAFTRTIGIAIATSLVTTGWTDAAIVNRQEIVDRFQGHHGLAAINGAGMPPDKALWTLDNLVQTQAVMMATNDTYWVLGSIVAVLVLAIWMAPKFKLRRA